MLAWLRRLFQPTDSWPTPKLFTGPYVVFTKEFDQVVTNAEIEGAIVRDRRFLDMPDFDGVDAEAAEFYERTARELVSALGDRPHDIAVSLLLDHSGSTRGRKICMIASMAGVMSECLSRLQIAHEVLGYTTSSWHGGKSATKWRAEGSPPQPGRLCDILHVIHKGFDEPNALSWDAMERMTDLNLLKENIDGEAIEWAASRLRARSEARKLLLVISDGAPVDDATLMANGPNILDTHLRSVTSSLVREGIIELYGVGIAYAMPRYYPQYVVVTDTNEIGLIALAALRGVLSSALNAPRAQQIVPLPQEQQSRAAGTQSG